MILHVVVGIEDVVLTVVLVLGRHHDLAEPAPEFAAGMDTEILAGVGVTTPGRVDLGQVLDRLPVALVDGPQYPGPVGARLAAEDAEEGRVALGLGLFALRRGGVPVFLQMLYDHVVVG